MPIFPFRTASTFSSVSSPPPSASGMPHTWMFARREYCSTLSALISRLSTFSSNDLIRESFASSWAVSWLVRLFRASILSDSSLGNRACLSLAITWSSFKSSISRSARWSGVSPLSSVVLRVLFFGPISFACCLNHRSR